MGPAYLSVSVEMIQSSVPLARVAADLIFVFAIAGSVESETFKLVKGVDVKGLNRLIMADLGVIQHGLH
nr:hypothetical protein CFP56_11495 [Quercus suber]